MGSVSMQHGQPFFLAHPQRRLVRYPPAAQSAACVCGSHGRGRWLLGWEPGTGLPAPRRELVVGLELYMLLLQPLLLHCAHAMLHGMPRAVLRGLSSVGLGV